MTWYASHIYAEPTQSVLSALSTNPLLSQGLYWIKHLHTHPWPDARLRHRLSNAGLVVVRELCEPDTEQSEWHTLYKHPTISWTDINDPSDVEIIVPPFLPVMAWGGVNKHVTDQPCPPLAFLRFLKHLSQNTGTRVSFYFHMSRSGMGVDREFAWVFAEKDSVFVRHAAGLYSVVRYTQSGETKVSTNWDNVLRFVLHGYGIALSRICYALGTAYFAPHARNFDWDAHKLS